MKVESTQRGKLPLPQRRRRQRLILHGHPMFRFRIIVSPQAPAREAKALPELASPAIPNGLHQPDQPARPQMCRAAPAPRHPPHPRPRIVCGTLHFQVVTRNCVAIGKQAFQIRRPVLSFMSPVRYLRPHHPRLVNRPFRRRNDYCGLPPGRPPFPSRCSHSIQHKEFEYQRQAHQVGKELATKLGWAHSMIVFHRRRGTP